MLVGYSIEPALLISLNPSSPRRFHLPRHRLNQIPTFVSRRPGHSPPCSCNYCTQSRKVGHNLQYLFKIRYLLLPQQLVGSRPSVILDGQQKWIMACRHRNQENYPRRFLIAPYEPGYDRNEAVALVIEGRDDSKSDPPFIPAAALSSMLEWILLGIKYFRRKPHEDLLPGGSPLHSCYGRPVDCAVQGCDIYTRDDRGDEEDCRNMHFSSTHVNSCGMIFR
jgi:hypothetical protein